MKNTTPPSAQTEFVQLQIDLWHQFDKEIEGGNTGAWMQSFFKALATYGDAIRASERTRLLSVESMKQESLEVITEFTHIKIIQARNLLRQSILSDMEKGSV